MREIRLHGSEGGGAETNRSFLPLSGLPRQGRFSGKSQEKRSYLAFNPN